MKKILLALLAITGVLFSGCSKSSDDPPTPSGKYTLTYLVGISSTEKCFDVVKVEYTGSDGKTITEAGTISLKDGWVERTAFVEAGFAANIRVYYDVNKDMPPPAGGTMTVDMYIKWGPDGGVRAQYNEAISYTSDDIARKIRDGQNYFEINTLLR